MLQAAHTINCITKFLAQHCDWALKILGISQHEGFVSSNFPSVPQELLLAHSVHRPPYSIGLFTHSEFRHILAWALDSYYRHYKLYQYVYTNSCATNHVCV
eukprot:1158091-Pelagomonas_calceolata.AAC.2